MQFASFTQYLSLFFLTYKRPQMLEEFSFTLGAEGIDGCEDDNMQIIMEPLYFGKINLRKKGLLPTPKGHRAWRVLLHQQ